MTRSNKMPKNPAKSRIKSLKSVTPQKATWRKWHNRRGLLARQAADERRYDRLIGRFDIIHHVTTTRSDFMSPFLFQLPLLSTCHHWPVPSTCSINLFHQPVTSTRSVNLLSPLLFHPFHLISSTLQSIPSISIATSLSAGDRYCLICLRLCLLLPRYQSI